MIICYFAPYPKNKPSALKDPILCLGGQSSPNNLPIKPIVSENLSQLIDYQELNIIY
jgi:hypothetical protein